MATYRRGDKVWIKYNDDLGPISGQMVKILSGPDEDGMYRVVFTTTGYVSADSIHPPMTTAKLCETCGKPIPEGRRMALRRYCSYSCSPAISAAYEEG